jgi:DNA-binding transcriptional ArsR family regulator
MSDVFDALAHPVRRKVLKLLRKRAMSAGELAEAFDLAKPTLSGHFAVLKAADLVTTERRGTTILYRINMSVLEEAIAALMDLAGMGKEAKP